MEVKIILSTQFLRNLDHLKELIVEIREMEKEYNCHCSLLEVKLDLDYDLTPKLFVDKRKENLK